MGHDPVRAGSRRRKGPMTTAEFPSEGMELTHILVVGDAGRSRDFYRDVLGAELYREYGGTSVVLRVFGTWLLLVTGGGFDSLSSRRCPSGSRKKQRTSHS